ncbi:hypothetical protein HMSSN036_04090 [Paenibacillus macerans]|nr:hypothetical protein HMSSN036_04090 [Paenibacillus macerans]
MFKVLVSDPISDMGIQQLMDADDIAVEKKTGLSEDELVEIIAEYDGLLVRSQTKVTEKIMAAASRLKVIGRAGVGVDNIDLEAATKRGIIVINAPDGNTITTCEHAFAMMMALARHIPQAYAKTISGQWDRKFLGVELRNKTLGVLGMGPDRQRGGQTRQGVRDGDFRLRSVPDGRSRREAWGQAGHGRRHRQKRRLYYGPHAADTGNQAYDRPSAI